MGAIFLSKENASLDNTISTHYCFYCCSVIAIDSLEYRYTVVVVHCYTVHAFGVKLSQNSRFLLLSFFFLQILSISYAF